MRAAHAPAAGATVPSHYRWCVGCGSDHPTGMHLQIVAREGLAVTGRFTVTEHHQGAPGLAHGGMLATAVDEILGSLSWLLDGPIVTGRLEVDYRRPVPVGRTVHIDAEVVGVKGRKVFTRAVGRLDDVEGQIAIAAAALLILVPLQHFVDNGTAEHVRRAVEDRAAGGPTWRPDGEQHVVEFNP